MRWRVLTNILRFKKDRDGAAAVEFGLIAPAMLLIFFAIIEVSDLLSANRRLTTATSSLADLTTQMTQVLDADVPVLYAAGRAMLAPYDGDKLNQVVTSVRWEADEDDPVVDWSIADGPDAVAHAPGAAFDLPEGIIAEGGSVIAVEMNYNHASRFSQLVIGEVEFADSFYLRPRRALWIPRCKDDDPCPE